MQTHKAIYGYEADCSHVESSSAESATQASALDSLSLQLPADMIALDICSCVKSNHKLANPPNLVFH